jgi:hypothetical protein
MLSQTCSRDEHERTYEQLQSSIGVTAGGASPAVGHKTCTTERFCTYLSTRLSVARQLRGFYTRPVHRRQRYDAHCGRRSSEDKFMSRIEKTFGREAVILYGDWGRNPNLKHQPPSPGVGLRRRVARAFETYLVSEYKTSSSCPKCGSDVTHPRERDGDPVHHLLQCTNSGQHCSTLWWNRDDLGALNILKNGLHALATGSWHALFRRDSAAPRARTTRASSSRG